jgi:hypothetical protein
MPKFTHVTIIADDGDEVTILDIQKMENFNVIKKFTKPRGINDQVLSQDIESITFTGIPRPLRDGTRYVTVTKVKE